MDGKEKPVTEVQQQLMLWVEQTKRLLVSLPTCFSELEQLKGEAGRFNERMSALERENKELRRSRDDLTKTFGKLKELIVKGLGEVIATPPKLLILTLERAHPFVEPAGLPLQLL